ncbi:unnamed protein product [Penicillium nalgiovense]|uniref:Uncharacterized protein n=1 Tax=Penicillium nalgiovense TaxID=60175 RepID=A0A9W4HVR1_PENNA|nr:unnamed protein product [Penicillium nalgiovense]CAG7963812.1 unnamed protein product [Penicillium nalgiovense]CAG7964818.1 unnamed protein product [Penicillium nalgiovense]CAG7972193.1 unnamed protein product [Penicillium nalgiovense]CAG7972925.1 unnamed protein product [Penicillium nalgiovense]
MICSIFTLVFFAVGASAQDEETPGLASPAVNWAALLDKSSWLAFVVVVSVLLYRFGTAGIRICSHLAMEYYYYIENMTLTAFQAASIELSNLPPLPASGSTPDLLDSPVPDSGSPTLVEVSARRRLITK